MIDGMNSLAPFRTKKEKMNKSSDVDKLCDE
jgi:hypothetical protein